jgi:hypothetical protein
MSQIPIENEDNRSVAASDFFQFDQPEEVVGQETQVTTKTTTTTATTI